MYCQWPGIGFVTAVAIRPGGALGTTSIAERRRDGPEMCAEINQTLRMEDIRRVVGAYGGIVDQANTQRGKPGVTPFWWVENLQKTVCMGINQLMKR